MKPKPVRKYAPPKYPTRLQIAARPALLHRHQPPAWRKWPELTGAAGLFLLADAARLPAADNPPKGGPRPTQTNAVAIVAPIFLHGEGRGATGCVVMSPPVFLSEEEALQVIREELAGKGVKLATNQTAVAGVNVWAQYKTGVQTIKEPFKADAADPEKRVFVEFLGERKAFRWQRERAMELEDQNIWSQLMSTVRSYDLPRTAHYVADRVKQDATNKVYFGTFYDPIAKSLEPSQRLDGLLAEKTPPGKPPPPGPWADAKAESRRLLRLQVQDFIKWLQAQGAI
jgi:hypothetical protein